jgi:hypothetical protein
MTVSGKCIQTETEFRGGSVPLPAFYILVCLLITGAHPAQRDYFQAVMEPPAGVISGVGQVQPESYLGYASMMTEGTLPLLFMQYKHVDTDASVILDTQRARFLRIEEEYPWIRVIPQYGISMTHDGSPEEHYEQRCTAMENVPMRSVRFEREVPDRRSTWYTHSPRSTLPSPPRSIHLRLAADTRIRLSYRRPCMSRKMSEKRLLSGQRFDTPESIPLHGQTRLCSTRSGRIGRQI